LVDELLIARPSAGRKTVRGREVVISYGTVASDVLLANYGFVPADNVHNHVCVFERELWLMLKLLHDEDESLPLRTELLVTLMKGFKVSADSAPVP
jgi:hypothetical protein